MNRSSFASRLVICTLLLLLGSVAALAKPSLETYGALPTVQMMSVSPDGSMIAFRRHSTDEDIVIVYSLAERKVIRGIDVREVRPSQLYFLDRSRVIVVASAERTLSGYRGRHRISTAFALDIVDGSLTQLLKPGDNIISGQAGLGHIVGMAKDGSLFMPAYVERRSSGNAKPDYALMKVDMASPRRPAIATRGTANTIDYFVDEDGNILAEEIFNDHTNVHSILARHDGKEVEIYREETEIPVIGIAALTSDRQSLIFEADSHDVDRVSYYTMALKDGSVSGPIFERQDADVEAILVDVNRIAYGVVYSGLTPTYEFFDDQVTERVKAIQAEFPGNSVWLSDATPDLRHLVIQVEGTATAGEYYLVSDEGQKLLLSSVRPDVAPQDVNPVIAYEYRARDGVRIPALLTVPREQAEDPRQLPAVMLPHGGPESHDWLEFDWLAQALASEGYVVIQPQFRGSSGFGLQHLLAGRGQWGRQTQEDITDALQNAVSEGVVDPDRVCIAGASYGGFAALAGGAFTPQLYKCVVSINGVSDVRKMLAWEKSQHGRGHWALSYWNDVIAKGDTSKATLDSISPANFAEKFTAPVLLVHGDKDDVVAFDQSRHMEKQLERAEKAVRLVKLKGEDHYLSSPVTRLKCLKETVEFINAHIG